ncbi:MAG: hypothetical protein DME24_17905 [Verrucomicrobia bacterium]|nr:MAG: hypothetical protein DME24_17905 [Verrucomicrobiota bacterium]
MNTDKHGYKRDAQGSGDSNADFSPLQGRSPVAVRRGLVRSEAKQTETRAPRILSVSIRVHPWFNLQIY